MSKKLIITEEEKNNIKSLYNVNEQFEFDKIIDYLKDVLKNKDKYFDKFKNTVNDLTSDSDDSKTEPLDNITDKGQKLLDNQSFQDKLDRHYNQVLQYLIRRLLVNLWGVLEV